MELEAQVRSEVEQDRFFERNVRQCAKHPDRFGVDVADGSDAAAACERQMLRDYAALYRQDLNLVRLPIPPSGPEGGQI